MNDLPDVVTNCSIESYVDDTKLFISFATIDKDSAFGQIGHDLKKVAEWYVLCQSTADQTSKDKIDIFWHECVGGNVE